MAQARINIIEPNGVRRSMPLGMHRLVIGRDPACEIPINYERISRQHVQLFFDGAECYVTDLESKNGTYLGKTRLTPNVPTSWSPDLPMRVGDVYFNLEIPHYKAVRQEVMGQMETMAGVVFPPPQPQRSQRTLWLGLSALALLCVCAGLAGLALFYLTT